MRDIPGRGWRIAGLLCLVTAVLCFEIGTARADEFFQVRDENPLIRGFYLPLPSDSRLNAAQQLSATFLISNTLNSQNNAHESLLVDGESDTLILAYDNLLMDSWRYRFTLPLIHDSGGILDRPIDTWHQAFGLPQGPRPQFPENKIVYSYSGRGNVDIDIHQAGSAVGNLAAELGWYALDNEQRTFSFWGGLAAPTGSVAKLSSDGAWDGSLWAHGALRWPNWQLAGELGVAQPFGDEIFAGYAHRTSTFARLALTRALGSLWSLRAQLDGQSGHVADSQIRFLGPSLQLTVGAARRLHNSRWRIEFGFAEDVAVNTAPDITFFLGIRSQ
jgi:hypothetical protein